MTVSPASSWKRITEEHTLPSGRVVELRPIDPIEVVMSSGNVPGNLSSFIAKSMSGKAAALNLEAQDAAFMPELAARVCKAAFINPRIVDHEPDYEAGEIELADIPFVDKMDVFSWAFSAGGQRDAAVAFPQQ